jgi:hypothetical protein
MNCVMSGTDVAYAGLLLPHCLRDQAMVSDQDRASPYPHGEYSADSDVLDPLTEFRVFADGTQVATCTDVSSCITTCFLMYWIFDIAYPKCFNGTLSFLDNIVFKKKSVPLRQKVLTFVNKF